MIDYLHFLSKISVLLTGEIDTCELQSVIKSTLQEHAALNKFAIYVFDSVTNTIRSCDSSWSVIPDDSEVYKAYKEIQGEDFIINSKAYKIPASANGISFKIRSLFLPISNGIIEMEFEENTTIDVDFLVLVKILASQVSLKLQNIVLSEQSKINVEFHDSMKNIAKIIETQYETNYIIPIIGEMIDKFVSDHLVYIFINNELVWPSSCKDPKIFELIKCLNNKSEYILTPDKKIGLFPMISENKLLGCIVTKSTDNILSEKEIEYLEQLSNQSATTLNRANVYAEILKHATLDALTGFYNRRQLEERIKQEASSAKRQHRSLCAIMTDIDYFKKVNDTYGHATGDLVLKTVSREIKNQLRDYDVAGRYGGEEFVILLPFTKLEEAKMVAERLRKAVEAKKIETSDKKHINVTISLGVAEYKEKDFIENADKALYKAKESGRNKVIVYESNM